MSNIDMSQVISAQRRRDRQREAEAAKARAYLARTDWYVLRQVETGQPVPAKVSDKRRAARQAAKPPA